jgi:hypothetical protein
MKDTYTILSTKGEVEAFKSSTVWTDMTEELKAIQQRAISDLVDTARNCVDGSYDLSRTLSNIGLAMGMFKGVESLLSIPDELIRTINEHNLLVEKQRKQED